MIMIAVNELNSSFPSYIVIVESYSRRKKSERRRKAGKEIQEKEGR